MNENFEVIDEGMSRYGLHRLHVMQMGKPVDLEELIRERVPEDGIVETHYLYEEADLGVYHARIWWRSPTLPSPNPQIGFGEGECPTPDSSRKSENVFGEGECPNLDPSRESENAFGEGKEVEDV